MLYKAAMYVWNLFSPTRENQKRKPRHKHSFVFCPKMYILQLHCIIVTFYQRKKKKKDLNLNGSHQDFLGSAVLGIKGLWLRALEKKNCQYCQLISAKIILTIWIFYVHHNSLSILEFYFVLPFFYASFGNLNYFLVLV